MTTNTDQFSLEGRTALVTGGSRGLGAAIAAGLRQAGARVAVLARTADQVAVAEQQLGVTGVVGDVTGDPAELLNRVESEFDASLTTIVHAAGVQHREPAETFSLDEWNRVLAVNLTAPFRLSQELGRRQLADGVRGNHIFVGSLTSTLSIPEIAAYTASKSGVYGVVRNLSTEWASRGVRVNGIAPGYFRTGLTEALFTDAQRYNAMRARIPMGRFGNPDELAGIAVFLASDASSYVSGQLIAVDGGWSSA